MAIDSINGNWEQTIAYLLEAYEPVNGSWLQAIANALANLPTPSDAGLISTIAANYTSLIATTGATAGDFAYVENAEGTQWLPGSLGGTYYSSGLYYYTGVIWTDALPPIENQLYLDTIAINGKLDLTGGTITGNLVVNNSFTASTGNFITGVNISTLGSGTSVVTLGLDAFGNVVSGSTVSPIDEVIYFNSVDPNLSGTTFDPNTPLLINTLYVSQVNSTTWTSNGITYSTYTGTSISNTPFTYAGTQIDAGSNKSASISRSGSTFVGYSTGLTSTVRFGVVGTGGTMSFRVFENGSVAEGLNTTASGNRSHAEGQSTTASGTTSHAEGLSTRALGIYSHAEGNSTLASGARAHAEGLLTTASGDFGSHAEGNETIASNESAHAEGYRTTASGILSHAEGWSTIASGTTSHAEGYLTVAGGIYSHSEGLSTRATGDRSHAEGNATTASGLISHAQGSSTIASGQYSHSEGFSTIASSTSCHAEGTLTTASASGAHAEGQNTTASGVRSHAEGELTIASGNYAHAGGLSTIASGTASFVHGSGSTASGIGTIVLGNGITGATNNTVFVNSIIPSNGATGTFTTVDLKTVTVTNGIITSII